jgi:hypothetical protein
MNAIIRNCLIFGFLVVVGCATRHQPTIVGRWTVLGTGDVVVLSKDHSARLASGGKTTTGSYRMGAHDLLILTLPGATPSSQAQIVPYFIWPDDWADRTLRPFR